MAADSTVTDEMIVPNNEEEEMAPVNGIDAVDGSGDGIIGSDDDASIIVISDDDEETVPKRTFLSPYAESALMFVKTYALCEYAIAAIAGSRKFFKKSCYGCEIDHPSQRQHSCLMDDPSDLYPVYIDSILKKEVDHRVVRKNVESDIRVFVLIWGKDYIAEFFDEFLPKPGDNEWDEWAVEVASCMTSLSSLIDYSRIERYYDDDDNDDQSREGHESTVEEEDIADGEIE
jgi:hypothetical protein